MIKIFILLNFLILSTFSDELRWVDEQIQAIKPPRKGVSNQIINQLKDPFIFLKIKTIKNDNKITIKTIYKSKKVKYKHKRVKWFIKSNYTNKNFTLEAIINKTALINKKWYKLGQKIKTYTIKEITNTKVVLIKGSRVIMLSTDTKNKTLKFNNN